MNPPNQENSRQRLQQQQNLETEQQTRTRAKVEFGTVEEMLRHDAAQTRVPAEIEKRLAESLARETPPAPVPWWKRLFGRS